MTWLHMSGAGNLFLVGQASDVDSTPLSTEEVVTLITNHPRPDGLPIEGVLLLRSINDASFDAEYYNPDGSFGMMCGNGARCIVRFAVDRGVDASGRIHFTLNRQPYTADVHPDGMVSIHLPPPRSERVFEKGALEGVDTDVYYVDVNSDHVVIDGPRDETRPIVGMLRTNPAFPQGANVNMVDMVTDDTVALSTYERGVEGVTGACGTGAVSTAIALWRAGRTGTSLNVIPPSGRRLHVRIVVEHKEITELILTGDARYDEDH
jgi:diaminopimelate epimerase